MDYTTITHLATLANWLLGLGGEPQHLAVEIFHIINRVLYGG